MSLHGSAVAIVAIVLGCAARADVLLVPAQHATIQAAIDAAADGDEVRVAPGTYAEAISFAGKSITVRSAAGAPATIIDAAGQLSSAVHFISGEGPDAVLEGFTIRGGSGEIPPGSALLNGGGGIIIFNASPVVRSCLLRDNMADDGGAVYVTGLVSAPRFEGCRFLDNTATTSGGGAVDSVFASPIFVACRFIGNSGKEGGAIRVISEGIVAVTNCFFAGNVATGNFGGTGNGGGAINNQQGGHVVITNATFVGNLAVVGAGSRGGAIHTTHAGTLTEIANSIFWDNDDNYGFPQISNSDDSTTIVTNTCVQDGWIGDGGGNLSSDPQLVDADGPDDAYGTSDDSPLIANASPCVNAGDDAALPADVVTDILGHDRFVGAVDAGAVEVQSPILCPADLDASGDVGFGDVVIVLADWGCADDCAGDLDGDATVGLSDLLVVLSNWGPCD